jgi:hypothetical protein
MAISYLFFKSLFFFNITAQICVFPWLYNAIFWAIMDKELVSQKYFIVTLTHHTDLSFSPWQLFLVGRPHNHHCSRMPSHILHTYIPSESSWWCSHLNIHNTSQHHHLFILNNDTSGTGILIELLLLPLWHDKNLLIWCSTKFFLKDQLPIAVLIIYWYVRGIILYKTIPWTILMENVFLPKMDNLHHNIHTFLTIFRMIIFFNKFYFNFD